VSGRHVALAAPAAVALALAAYPAVASGYGVRATLQVFMWIVLAGSWNLISGLTGYVSFGHVAFFGAGAYAGAILMSKPAGPGSPRRSWAGSPPSSSRWSSATRACA